MFVIETWDFFILLRKRINIPPATDPRLKSLIVLCVVVKLAVWSVCVKITVNPTAPRTGNWQASYILRFENAGILGMLLKFLQSIDIIIICTYFWILVQYHCLDIKLYHHCRECHLVYTVATRKDLLSYCISCAFHGRRQLYTSVRFLLIYQTSCLQPSIWETFITSVYNLYLCTNYNNYI